MRIMLSLLFVGLVATSGCKKDVTKDIENLADRACACKGAEAGGGGGAECAEKVVDDLLALADKNRKARGDEDRAQAAARRLGECVIKAGMDPDKFMAKMKQLQAMDE